MSGRKASRPVPVSESEPRATNNLLAGIGCEAKPKSEIKQAAAPPVVGRQFGYWTIVQADASGKRATCRCACGAVHAVAIAALKNGDCTSCGCKPPTSENREAVRSSRARQMLLSDFGFLTKLNPRQREWR